MAHVERKLNLLRPFPSHVGTFDIKAHLYNWVARKPEYKTS